MRFTRTEIEGAWLIDLARIEDVRGSFARIWCARTFQEHGLDWSFVEGNMSYSRQKGTLRGLHYQVAPHEQAKLVWCLRGSIYDVIVDTRPHSPTRHAWAGFTLSAKNNQILYVPAGCAHGLQTTEDDTEIFYAASGYHNPKVEKGIRWDDPFFGIEWPAVESPIVSDKDAKWPDFKGEETDRDRNTK